MTTAFAFDLDGTITREEILPIIAAELDLEREMLTLTELTLSGAIDFEDSFRLRCAILRAVPISEVRRIVQRVQLAEHLVEFIQARPDDCYVVTGNLDVWVAPILDRLGCRSFTSVAKAQGDTLLNVASVLNKSEPVRTLLPRYERVVSVGDSVNDIPMFEEAHVRVAFGGVHRPAPSLYETSDYAVYTEEALCRLLTTL
ncbi:HAD family hydrolase [Mobilicoccus pelagius]|uniref:phosphoserine phosphatase n=1 Tax=Mobilicoccus pelagius NBRC 104925 TaxID=1089455 RepID=H5UQW2_9MICO|nr:HAD family phosphatase [Mobilicoccus pelagius]GAB48120.1 phosphoserine phosphatase [Mobilicoccus pelagius NBRC 104925]